MRYDERSGCGVNVEYVERSGAPLVGLRFHTFYGERGAHDLTLAQVDQLRAALDAVSKTARAVDALRPLPAA
ncbi:hypothetical protein Drose_36740 [Dactylosporangium roseum]|uniref:Uncharacterized protein n=1 Tax=Dactylosporangium roseum TaxID=47989 RepID=A0ABY5Z386_9ACTN|nr:hypothetical protein [Dactylosporangium roseum]UWZ36503.1 hypothetical protein Drose_36740 [Dactylosporangium roseum]